MKKGKVSTVQKTMKDPELVDMFNKMVGASDPDPAIVVPKYQRLLENARKFIQLLEKLCISPFAKTFISEEVAFTQITNFVMAANGFLSGADLERNNHVLSGKNLAEVNSDRQKMADFLNNMNNEYSVENLGERYKALRESSVIKEMIMTARAIKAALMIEKERTHSEKHNLESRTELSDKFITESLGNELTLFSFSGLNFKIVMYSDLLVDKLREYILLVLHFMYIRCLAVVKDITAPDIDVDKFTEIVVANIDEIRKHIPRCDKAFDKIASSVSLLKENFGEYYKDFVTSQNSNPGIIVENFVIDVANKHKADLQTTRQFRQIISFYRNKISGKKIEDPRVKKMLNLVGENLDILEGKLTNKPPS